MTERQQRFERLVDAQAYARAWGYARRLSRWAGLPDASAEDLLQESLALAWRGLDSLRDESAALGWLLAIIRRRHLSRLAAQRRQAAELLEPSFDPPDARDADDPRLSAALEALARLPDGPRELLALHYLHGLSQAETAVALGIAPRAVRMRLHRARKLLARTAAQSIPAAAAGLTAARRNP